MIATYKMEINLWRLIFGYLIFQMIAINRITSTKGIQNIVHNLSHDWELFTLLLRSELRNVLSIAATLPSFISDGAKMSAP